MKGDNVVDKSKNMEWYQGSTLMYLLENVHISGDENHIDCRFPVQYVIRPQATEFHDSGVMPDASQEVFSSPAIV